MADGQIVVTVRNLRRQGVDLPLSVDDEGYIVFNRQGPFAVDPELDLPDMKNMLNLLEQIALKKRGKPRPS